MIRKYFNHHSRERDDGLFLWLLIGVLLLAPASLSAEPLKTGPYGLGYIDLPEGAVSENDYLVTIFSEGLIFEPTAWTHQIIFPQFPAAPVEGCLSVARLQLKSGVVKTSLPGSLTFPCDNLPQNVQVKGWINGAWTQIPSTTDEAGHIKIHFTDLTTYAVFPSESDGPDLPQI